MAEPPLIQFNSGRFRQNIAASRWSLAGGKYHQVKNLLPSRPSDIRVDDSRVSSQFFLFHRVNSTPLKPNPICLFRLVPIPLEILAKSSHIHIEDRGLHLTIASLLGKQCFFDGEHTADGGAVVGICMYVPGTHTLKPGYVANLFAIAGTHQFTLRGPASTYYSFELYAGNYIGNLTVAVCVQPVSCRIKGAKACGQDNRPNFHLKLPRPL